MSEEAARRSGLFIVEGLPPEELPEHCDLTWLTAPGGQVAGETLQRRCAVDDPEYLIRAQRGYSYALYIGPHSMEDCPFKDSDFMPYVYGPPFGERS